MPGIPTPNTDIAALVPATIKGRTSPIISTAPGERDGTRAGGGTDPVDPPYDPVGVIFADNFDDQPDWTSGLPGQSFTPNNSGGAATGGWNVDITQRAGTHTIPVGWDLVRQTAAYAPSKGDPDKHENIEITAGSTAENPNRARGGIGKSFVSWRDSRSQGFGSDGILLKYFPEGYDQLYVEFWINFSNEFIAAYHDDYGTSSDTTGLSKLFRIYHWKGTGDPFLYHGEDYYENKNPALLWGFEGRPDHQSGYGFRNLLSFLTKRAHPALPGEEDFLDENGVPTNNYSTSYHPTSTVRQGGGHLIDQNTGNPIDPEMFAPDVDTIFGDETHWTKMGFFVKMNSVPGAFDGVFKQWVDNKCIVDFNTVQWVSAAKTMEKWNVVALGGNDSFHKYPAEQKYEHWYAIDDLVIRDSIPQELL